MTAQNSGERPPGPSTLVLQKVVEVRPEEVRILFLSGAYFFLILTAYYIIRPIRNEMAVAGGVENLAWLFTGTLALTLLVHRLPPFSGPWSAHGLFCHHRPSGEHSDPLHPGLSHRPNHQVVRPGSDSGNPSHGYGAGLRGTGTHAYPGPGTSHAGFPERAACVHLDVCGNWAGAGPAETEQGSADSTSAACPNPLPGSAELKLAYHGGVLWAGPQVLYEWS